MKNLFFVAFLFLSYNCLAQVDNGTTRDTVGVYTVVEEEASFKGKEGWRSYLEKNLKFPQSWIDTLEKKKVKYSVYEIAVKFIVCSDGGVCEVQLVDEAPAALAAEAIRIIKKSDKMWLPGKQNGLSVKSYHEQRIYFAYSTQ